MLQYFLIETAIELVLLVACIAVFYYRRNILIPLFRGYLKRFLGIYSLESKMEYREYKSQLHANRLNNHLRHINVLEGKPARKLAIVEDTDNDCTCDECLSEDYDGFNNEEDFTG